MTLARPSYRDIPLYAPSKGPECPIDLSDNTNLFGVPPAAERALREAVAGRVTRYPSLYGGALKAAIAAYAGCAPEQVVTGCGSDDVIDCTLRAFVGEGERLAFPDPTFVMMPIFAKVNGIQAVPVPLTREGDIDAEGLLATRAKVLYLCTPNNPTGTVASRAAVERVLNEAPGIVLLDEAYAEFARESYLEAARTRRNVLVTRTLSKAFGLAGMRVGYAVGAPELVSEVEKARGPYKISSVAERMAEAALTEDLEWVRARAAEAVEVRERLAAELVRQGLRPLRSEANFAFVPLPGAPEVARRMRERGVNVRAFQGLTGIGDALRIGCGPWPLMEAALKALQEARG
ncbi:histidinol-phosphate aminotransferase family protein [Aggregicoccus sp. 17bor-14]|uniref:pyridoxal phosphate-dependent aminotransferase n=1 Tax=Myxococcaceae TaxID=31 RepID=UPI00129D0D40|nr:MULTISPECIES: histidinol-phosphate transaminase [Myxococcaceae]MBF5044154.1 histidinol-phosphate aminotransferase family protein [Simulacricoccus sp. 17bor-14]MRI89904.1 histidinol-phosphate aminotransferase family protein [Aggregicoccus sp. 17bor-14]